MMVAEIFTALLFPSFAGSCLAAVILLARPLTGKVFGYSWHYYIWLCVLIAMLIPIRFNLPRKTDIAPGVLTSVQTEQAVPAGQVQNTAAPAAQTNRGINLPQTGTGFIKSIVDNKPIIIAYVWLAGTTMLMLINIIGYIRLIIKIRKHSALIPCPELAEFTKRKVEVRVWENTSSPFLVGIVKPALVLPARRFTQEQLNNILRHEMIHLRRHDILYKWLTAFVKCLHWFNPMIWAIAKQINTECEISCDMAVTRNLSREEEMSYVDTLLSLLPTEKTKQIPLTTQMASGKKILKRRFLMMKTKKTTGKFVSVLSVVLALTMFSATVFASGVLSGLTDADYTIEITNNGKEIKLENKPFIENNTVYLPLRELLVSEGVKNENITYNNGYVEFSVNAIPAVEYRGEEYDFWINRVLIGSPYAYIGGHSHGTTENAELLRSPIIKDGTTYVPFDLFEKLENQGVFEGLAVSVQSKTKDVSNLSGTLYLNDDVNFTIEIPLSWHGKYTVRSADNTVTFLQNATYDKYGEGSGTLFRIEKVNADDAEEILNLLGCSKLLYSNGRYAYISEVPTDVQYPIWTNRDEEDVEIAAEYEDMAKDIDNIGKSFDTIVKYLPLYN